MVADRRARLAAAAAVLLLAVAAPKPAGAPKLLPPYVCSDMLASNYAGQAVGDTVDAEAEVVGGPVCSYSCTRMAAHFGAAAP